MAYRTLRSDCVIETIERLERRIGARFPEAGLRKVCGTLLETAQRCAGAAHRLNQPAHAIRLSVYGVWTLGAAGLLWILVSLHYEDLGLDAARLVQALEPAMNLAVLVGLGVLSLGRLEDGWKRTRALEYLHELRSIAHVVDMHQLTKDPYRAMPGALAPTEFSPQASLPPERLARYLDYCSEMLSLTGKLAALLAQSCRDGEVAEAASDIESLTTGLSQKIWQKMSALEHARGVSPPAVSASAPSGR